MGRPTKDYEREQFCQFLADGWPLAAAYRSAGFKGDTSNASRLAQDPRIVFRVDQLRKQKEADANKPVDAEAKLPGAEGLQKVAVEARASKNYGAAVAAYKELADYDGSGEALAPPPESRSDGELILALLPTLKRFLQALGIPLRSDADLQRAALQSIGNAGACGFTDGEGNPIPIDDKHQGAKRAPRLNLN